MSDKKVWVVTSGCYSDYQICRIFDSEEKANKIIDDDLEMQYSKQRTRIRDNDGNWYKASLVSLVKQGVLTKEEAMKKVETDYGVEEWEVE